MTSIFSRILLQVIKFFEMTGKLNFSFTIKALEELRFKTLSALITQAYCIRSLLNFLRFRCSINCIVVRKLLRFISFSRQASNIQSVNTTCRVRSERPCPPNKYRTPSGVCNNVRHPAWGARGSPFLKLLSSEYSDGKTLHNISFISSKRGFA